MQRQIKIFPIRMVKDELNNREGDEAQKDKKKIFKT
jgi:hypothetical protein